MYMTVLAQVSNVTNITNHYYYYLQLAKKWCINKVFTNHYLNYGLYLKILKYQKIFKVIVYCSSIVHAWIEYNYLP